MVINETLVTASVDFATSQATAPIKEQIITVGVKTFFKLAISILSLLGLKYVPLPPVQVVLGVIFGISSILTILSALELFNLFLAVMTSTLI
jgi:hypothetical protein